MAVNVLGLPLQLQASPVQIQDLLGGLKAGAVLKGRVIEALPGDKVVLNLRGQNLVAQLPAGASVERGDILNLQVTQPQVAGAATSTVTLRLLSALAETGAAQAAPAPTAPDQGAAPGPALPPQAVIDQALSAARLPLTPANQQIARSLAQWGVPLEPQTLQTAAHALEALIANESPAAAAPAPTLPAPVQNALQSALQQLQVAAQLSPPGPAAVVLQQAVRDIQAALSPPTPPSTATSSAPSVAAQAQAPAQAPVPQAPAASPAPPVPAASTQTAPATVASAGSAPPPSPAEFVAQVQAGVTALLQSPQAAPLQSLQAALSSLPAVAQAAQETQPATLPTAQPNGAPVTAAPAPEPTLPVTLAPTIEAPITASSTGSAATAASSPAPSLPLQGLVQREATAPLLALASQSSRPATVESLQKALTQQISALQDAGSVPAGRLVQAVQAQFPQADPVQVLQTAAQTLQSAQSALAALPDPQAPIQAGQLQQVLADAGIATPRVALQSFPIETIAESVAWLQARDLPIQRPLVEAVASFLQQDHNALPAAARAVEQAQALPEPFVQQRPALQTAIQDAHTALQQAVIHADQPGLAQQLQAWGAQQGLDLEAVLLTALPSHSAAPATAGPAPAGGLPVIAAEAPALRPAFQQLEQQLRHALTDDSAQKGDTAARIQSALGDAQNANRALSALPLQAQAAPAFDTVHMPLPVMMGQDMGGQLSVTWRQGRDRSLNEKDPVSVALSLNTGSLGTVKVLLQVWKDAASARVLAQDAPTADFLSDGADDLRSGFAERTPFKLQSLDFAVDAPGRRAEGTPSVEAPIGGLTLSA